MDKSFIGSGSIDAYVLCNYMNNKLKTDVITAKDGDSVNWNCEFLVSALLSFPSYINGLFAKEFWNDCVFGDHIF